MNKKIYRGDVLREIAFNHKNKRLDRKTLSKCRNWVMGANVQKDLIEVLNESFYGVVYCGFHAGSWRLGIERYASILEDQTHYFEARTYDDLFRQVQLFLEKI